MSHSPQSTIASDNEMLRYDRGWAALNRLLRSGAAFSGNERNSFFLNLGQARFANVSAASGIDWPDDGRGLALVDWDFDGRVDLWVSNRTGPRVRFLRNETATGHRFLAVQLEGRASNRDAVGARLELYLAGESRPMLKTRHAGSGFLSQSSRWVHFGLGAAERIERLVIRWPGGKVQTLTDLAPDRHYMIVEGENAETWQPPRGALRWAASNVELPAATHRGRVVLLGPPPLPEGLTYIDAQGREALLSDLHGKPLLVNFWVPWCSPCLAELAEWTRERGRLEAAGLGVLAVCVDEPSADRAADLKKLLATRDELGLGVPVALATARLVEALELLEKTYVGKQRPLPVPSSFLIDRQGRLLAIYRGPVPLEQLLEDLRLVDATADQRLAAALPFAGPWLSPTEPIPAYQVILSYLDADRTDGAKRYAQQLIELYLQQMPHAPAESRAALRQQLAQCHALLGAMLFDEQQLEKGIEHFQKGLALTPHNRHLHLEVVRAYEKSGRIAECVGHLRAALAVKPDDPANVARLARMLSALGDHDEAIALLRPAAEQSTDADAHARLAAALLTGGNVPQAIESLRRAIELRPGNVLATNDLAWILATHPDQAIRDGAEAVTLAEEACRATESRVPTLLDTLAAAYAETGRFDQAIESARRARQLADEAGNVSLAERLEARLRLYEASQPYRDESLASSSN